jgi:hypothetical protein
MKDMSSKEIVMYNQFAGLSAVYIPNITSMMHSKASIERLTEGKFALLLLQLNILFFF